MQRKHRFPLGFSADGRIQQIAEEIVDFAKRILFSRSNTMQNHDSDLRRATVATPLAAKSRGLLLNLGSPHGQRVESLTFSSFCQ
jgi:hypothetical protein